MLETRINFVKFSLFFAGLSFLFNLLAVGSHILSAFSMSALLFIATLASLSVATDRLANVAIKSRADIEKALKICDPTARRLKRKDKPAKNKLNLTKLIRVSSILTSR